MGNFSTNIIIESGCNCCCDCVHIQICCFKPSSATVTITWDLTAAYAAAVGAGMPPCAAMAAHLTGSLTGTFDGGNAFSDGSGPIMQWDPSHLWWEWGYTFVADGVAVGSHGNIDPFVNFLLTDCCGGHDGDAGISVSPTVCPDTYAWLLANGNPAGVLSGGTFTLAFASNPCCVADADAGTCACNDQKDCTGACP